MDGSPQEPDVHDLLDHWKCHRALVILVFDFGSAELLNKLRNASYMFRNILFGESHNLPHQNWNWRVHFLTILRIARFRIGNNKFIDSQRRMVHGKSNECIKHGVLDPE